MGLHNAFTAVYGATALAGLRNLDYQANPEVRNDVSIGSPYPQFAAIVGQKPRLLFAADRIDTLLGITGSSGAKIDATNNLVGYFAALDEDGLPLAGAVHRAYTATRGLLVPRRLQCSHRQAAMVDCEAILRSEDGSAHPITIADNVALPTLPSADVQHTLGKIQLGVAGLAPLNFDLDCPTDLSIDFGNGAQTRGCSSDVYDVHTEQPGIQPVTTLTSLSAAAFGPNGVPPVGKKIKHDGTILYLRKYDEGIGFVDDATAEHIRITLDGVAVVTSHTGQGTSAAQVNLQITGKIAGGVVPVTINTASAIT